MEDIHVSVPVEYHLPVTSHWQTCIEETVQRLGIEFITLTLTLTCPLLNLT